MVASQAQRVVAVSLVLILALSALSFVPQSTAAQTDEWADSALNAQKIDPNQTISGTIDGTDDQDIFRIELSEGDHLNLETDVPFAEDHYQVAIETVYGEATLRDVTNANAKVSSWGNTYFDDLRDGNTVIEDITSVNNASWEIWAETDTVLQFTIRERSDEANVPYNWTFSSTRHPATATDTWADSDDEAQSVSSTGTYSGNLTTPRDSDVFTLDLNKGEHLKLEADVPTEQSELYVRMDVASGTASIKSISNATAQEYSHGSTYFDNLDDGYSTVEDLAEFTNATWEVWAETNATIEITIGESDKNAEFPYSWTIQTTHYPRTVGDKWPSDQENASLVSATGTYSGNLSTPNDQDTYFMQVEKGDYLSMEAKPDSAEKDFWTSLDVVEGTASIKHVENSTAQEYSYGRSYFDNLDDGYTTLTDIKSSAGGSWEVWAESNALLEVTVGDSDRNADIPYSWTIESTYHRSNTTDNWPDDVEKASRVNPTGSYTGNLSTPNDEDIFLYQLTDGQNISMQTRFPTAEQDAFVSLDVREGSASLHNLSNAKAQTSSRWGDTYFDDLTDGHSTISDFTHSAPASWRVQAESNAILAVTVSESNRNAPVYEWTLQSKLNGTITPPEAPQVSVSVDQTTPSVGEPVTLQATAPNSDTTTYTWDINGDGSTDATGATTTQQFTEPGQHTVSVTAENAGGSDTAAIILDVQSEPTADLSISTAGDEATPGETVTATAKIENNGTIATGIKLNVTAQPNWTITNSSSAGGIWSESNTTLTWDSLEPGTEVSPSMTLQVPSNTTSGEYHLTAMATATENATISKDASTKLTVINESQNPPAIVADRTPIDPDKDGVYEDVNGDGRLTVGDVQALFANLDKASQNPTGYDMNGDGRVTTGDVQALFASL